MENANRSQRPMLKKVKRPINRAPQAPVSTQNEPKKQTTNAESLVAKDTAKTVSAEPFSFNDISLPEESQAAQENHDVRPQKDVSLSNPFVSKKRSNDAFNLDAYLDDNNVPGNSEQKTEMASLSQPAQRRFLGEDDLPQIQPKLAEPRENNFDDSEDDYVPTSDLPPYLTKNILILLGCLAFFLGIIAAKLFFSNETVVRNGLQGVVVNPEVPKGRARCGVAERTQGCILYIMNPQRQEMPARDFYDLAAQLTGRQRFVIETGNMRYSNTKIRPGDIAQFNIPPM